jgi:hypothetical protein
VALTVDSLGPRGIASHCGGGLFPDQAFDAHAARRYRLARRPRFRDGFGTGNFLPPCRELNRAIREIFALIREA